jgi:hypothetical protein
MSTVFINRFSLLAVLCIVLLSAISCKNEQPTITDKNTSDPAIVGDEKENTKSISATRNIIQPKDLVYTWVDKLNVRDAPNLNGKTITTIQTEDAIEFTGIKSDKSETIVLRGVAYNEPWLKIVTADGKEGWVFGGAIKYETEKKGNAPIDDTKFDFPNFGSFDLSEWKNEGTKDESGGDAEIKTTTYSKNGQTIEVSKVDVGEYGYGSVHKLYDSNLRLLKQRDFNFMTDANFREIVEIVKDYTATPPKQYMRSQKLTKHYLQLNAYPLLANGQWKVSDLDDPQSLKPTQKDKN